MTNDELVKRLTELRNSIEPHQNHDWIVMELDAILADAAKEESAPAALRERLSACLTNRIIEGDEPLPCPFCGASAGMREAADEANYIECSKCGASTNLQYSLKEDGRPDLIERWNRRVIPSTPAPGLREADIFDADGSWSKKQWQRNAEFWNRSCLEAWQQRDWNADRIQELEKELAALSATPASSKEKFSEERCGCPMCEYHADRFYPGASSAKEEPR